MFQIPNDLVLIGRVLGSLDGFLGKYNPKVNMIQIAIPYIKKFLSHPREEGMGL